MSKEIYINKDEFSAEIDALSSAKESITDKMFVFAKGDLVLDTVDEIERIVEQLNKLYVAYRQRLEQDIKNMDVMIAEWMKVDESLAGKNFSEVIKVE